MLEYPKINTIFKRDEKGYLLLGQYSTPELEYLASNEWTFTEKIDGTGLRVFWDGQCASFHGRTDNAQMPPFLFDRLLELFPDEKFDRFIDVPLYLFGEGYGARIQKGGKYIPDGVDFILFDVRIGEWWLKREDVEELANQFGIKVVPVVGHGTIQDAIDMVKAGSVSTFGDFLAEGLVLKPKVDLLARNRQRIMTKIKHKDFE